MTLADVAWPVDAGKRLRSESMVRAVAASHDVDVAVLFADADPAVRPVPPDVNARWIVVPARLRSVPRAAIDVVVRREPWQAAVQDWTMVHRALAAFGGEYDLVWFGALDHFARLRNRVRAQRTIVDCDDVETEKLRRFLAMPRGDSSSWTDRVQRRIELPMWGAIQRQAVSAADAVLVCSNLDRSRLVAQAAPSDPTAMSRVAAIPNTYPDPGAVPRKQPDGPFTLTVVANYGTDQNLDAVAFAAREVLPVLHREMPDARIRLVGRRADRLAEFAGIAGLDIVGPVDTVDAELARAHAVLVPIRFGGGTRLKIIEAMAFGVPVISTTPGAEGIDAVDGEHLLLADSPEHIVSCAGQLRDSPTLADQLSSAGRALYERSYRPQVTAELVGQLLTRLFAGEAQH